MSAARSGAVLAAALVLAWIGSASCVQAQEKHNNAAGVVTNTGKNWVEVKCDGETEATAYHAPWSAAKKGEDLDAIKNIAIGNRVKFVWRQGDACRRLISIEVVAAKAAEEKKDK